MANKVQLTESKLIDILSEQVVSELSSDLLHRAASAAFKKNDHFSDDYKDMDKDEYGNPVDKRGRRWADRGRKFEKAAKARRKEELDSDDLVKQAKEVFDSVSGDIEWGENEFEGDETYGPTEGYVETEDGWKFTVPGQYDSPYDVHIEEDALIEFETPDGRTGEFYL